MIFLSIMVLVAAGIAAYALWKWHNVSEHVVSLVRANRDLEADLRRKDDDLARLQAEIAHLPKRGDHGHFVRR